MPFSQGHVLWLLQWSFCMCSLSWAGLCFFGLILSQSWGCFCHVGPVVKHMAVTSSAPASFLPLANQSSLVCPASVQILLLCCRVDNTILQNVFSLGKKKKQQCSCPFHVQLSMYKVLRCGNHHVSCKLLEYIEMLWALERKEIINTTWN